jgi:arylformamidase
LDFSTVDDTKGELAVLVDQVRRAVVWVHRNCDDFGGDPAHLYVVGHSTGAHLAAMALSSGWAEHGLPEKPIRGGVLVSGIYDLGPLRRTSRAKYINLDDDAERRLSPLHQIARLSSPLLLAVGSKESPETRRQAHIYAQAVTQAGKQVELVVGETYTHFDILETLGNPFGLLGRNLLKFVHGETG